MSLTEPTALRSAPLPNKPAEDDAPVAMADFLAPEQDLEESPDVNNLPELKVYSSSFDNTRHENVDDNNENLVDKLIAKAGGVATLAMCAAFNDSACPPGFEKIHAELIALFNRNYDFNRNPGTTDQRTKEEKEKEKQEEAGDNLREQFEHVEEEIMSQRKLDAMEWKGDKNEVWSFGGKDGTRQSWFDAAKKAREQLDDIAARQGWSAKKKKEQEDALAAYQAALKDNDPDAAKDAWDKLDPVLQQKIEAERKAALASGLAPEVAAEVAASAAKEQRNNFGSDIGSGSGDRAASSKGNIANFIQTAQKDGLQEISESSKEPDSSSEVKSNLEQNNNLKNQTALTATPDFVTEGGIKSNLSSTEEFNAAAVGNVKEPTVQPVQKVAVHTEYRVMSMMEG